MENLLRYVGLDLLVGLTIFVVGVMIWRKLDALLRAQYVQNELLGELLNQARAETASRSFYNEPGGVRGVQFKLRREPGDTA